jgi:hypothetical protein
MLACRSRSVKVGFARQLERELSAATELAAVAQERDSLLAEQVAERHIRLSDHRDAMRMASLGYVRELAAVKQERDAVLQSIEAQRKVFKEDSDMLENRLSKAVCELAEARRQVEALVKAAQNVPCAYCEARDFCDNRDPGLTCPEHLLAWSVEEAKKGA